MKALKPSYKENKRYLLVKSNLSENTREIYSKVQDAILDFSGVLGLSKCGMSVIRNNKNNKKENENKNYLILCVNRESVNLIKASLAVYPEKIHVEKIFGTLKKLINSSFID